MLDPPFGCRPSLESVQGQDIPLSKKCEESLAGSELGELPGTTGREADAKEVLRCKEQQLVIMLFWL